MVHHAWEASLLRFWEWKIAVSGIGEGAKGDKGPVNHLGMGKKLNINFSTEEDGQLVPVGLIQTIEGGR
jgi:hypothetical protein